jgi:hypothetical protein
MQPTRESWLCHVTCSIQSDDSIQVTCHKSLKQAVLNLMEGPPVPTGRIRGLHCSHVTQSNHSQHSILVTLIQAPRLGLLEPSIPGTWHTTVLSSASQSERCIPFVFLFLRACLHFIISTFSCLIYISVCTICAWSWRIPHANKEIFEFRGEWNMSIFARTVVLVNLLLLPTSTYTILI